MSIFTKACKASVLGILPALFLLAASISAPQAFAAPGDPPPAPPTANTTRNLQTPLPNQPSVNPNSSAFKIAVCDGPNLSSQPALLAQENARLQASEGRSYVPCDFNAVMLLIQHLINIMLVIGVLVAIVMFTYAGWLYISGKKGNIDKAHTIFPKILVGFIIMLSAWFIVYQILSWLTDNPGFKGLLGSP